MHRVRAFGGLLLLSAACSASPRDGDGASQPLVDESRAGGPCECALDQVCNSEAQCIARPQPATGESFGEVQLLHQAAPLQFSAVRDVGESAATFHDYEPKPNDDRPKFQISGGGECAFEVGTLYPSSYAGQVWPAGPALGAGNLSFDVTGSRVRIELNAFDRDEYGWGYFHGNVPPALTENSGVYPDFFDPSVLPSGAKFAVHNVGGPQIGANSLSGELPIDFKITQPPVESPGATASASDGLRVEWSPPQPSAYMEIFVTRGVAKSYDLLSCKVADNGSTVIPAKALQPFMGPVGPIGIQLRRTTERYTKVETAAGGVLHMSVFGRHARLGMVRLQ